MNTENFNEPTRIFSEQKINDDVAVRVAYFGERRVLQVANESGIWLNSDQNELLRFFPEAKTLKKWLDRNA